MERPITNQEKTFYILRRMIITTELKPGQKISEANLMEQLSVGRTPIRESLQQLKKQNLIKTIPQSGTYIQKIDIFQANNARFAREHLETEIMVEATAKLTNEYEKKLQKILNLQKKYTKEKNITKIFDLDNEFHKTCYQIANKKIIWQWINQFNTHLDRFRWLHLHSHVLDLDILLKDHENIFYALKQRNTEEVKYLTSKHIHGMLEARPHVISSFPGYFTE